MVTYISFFRCTFKILRHHSSDTASGPLPQHTIGRQPGPPLRMFLLPFFHHFFLLSHTYGHHKLITSTPNSGPFERRGQKKNLFGKSVRQNVVIAYFRVLWLHKWSDRSEVLQGVSWHKGESISIIFWGLLPFYFQISPSAYPKDKKNVCPPDKLSSNGIISSIVLYISLPYVDMKNFPHLYASI